MTQFARTVGIEVTLVSYGLVQDLLLRASGIGGLCGRAEPGLPSSSSSFGSTVADSVASQSNYSIRTVSSFTTTSASMDNAQPSRSKQSMVVNKTQGRQSRGVVTTESLEKNMPLTVL